MKDNDLLKQRFILLSFMSVPLLIQIEITEYLIITIRLSEISRPIAGLQGGLEETQAGV